MTKGTFTSESVTEGHPDKICDQIADSVLDSLLAQDPDSRVAVECMVTTGTVHVAGEVTTKGFADVNAIARGVLERIGYTNPEFGLDCHDAGVWVSIHEQSAEIATGVGRTGGLGAGDQCMTFGYAVDETPELMPFPIMAAHGLCRRLARVRKDRIIPGLGPDGKAQVTVEYADGRPKRITHIVIAQQHERSVAENSLRREIIEKVIKPVCGPHWNAEIEIHINAAGSFVVGGPEADTGLTGRKIVVDTYGAMARHGGGSFSGKDPTKADRSGGYLCRWIAKNIVASGLAARCETRLAFAIGGTEPLSFCVETFGTGRRDEGEIEGLVRECFPLTLAQVISRLDLKRPIYEKTAAYGHFGREDPDFTWEKTDMAAELSRKAGL